MKKLKTIICYIIDCVLISIIGLLLLQGPTLITKHDSITTSEKYLPSRYLVYEIKEEIKEEVKVETLDTIKQSENKEIEENKKIEHPVIKEEVPKKEEITPTFDVIETLIGKLSGYGPDCYGCTTNRTASGYYVGEGNIYYQDPTFGKVRILAGDSKYPFHTIVRIKNSNVDEEPILGIVLDRGGSIGIGEKYLFDLLYKTEVEASAFGVSQNVTFEILRIGS